MWATFSSLCADIPFQDPFYNNLSLHSTVEQHALAQEVTKTLQLHTCCTTFTYATIFIEITALAQQQPGNSDECLPFLSVYIFFHFGHGSAVREQEK